MASRRPFSYPRFQAFDANGLPLASGTAEFFDAGTTNNRDIYSDAALTTTAPNPVTLNSRGEPESGGGSAIDIYLDEQPYKIVLKDSSGSTVWTIDNYIIPNSILEPQDPNDASDQGTDQYEGTLARDPSDGEVFVVDFQSANTTTTPTYENTDGSLGAKTMTTRDGSALWAGALDGPHRLKYDGTDYLVLDPVQSSKNLGVDILASGTFSDDSSLDITDLTTDYRVVEFVLAGVVPETDAKGLYLRTSTDNGSTFDSGATDYAHQRHGVASGSAFASGSTGDTQVVVAPNLGSAAGEELSGTIRIYNPADSSILTKITGEFYHKNAAGSHQMLNVGGQRSLSEANDAVRLVMQSGNFASGSYEVYGYR